MSYKNYFSIAMNSWFHEFEVSERFYKEQMNELNELFSNM